MVKVRNSLKIIALMKKSTKEKVEQTPHTTGIQRIVLTNKTTYTTNLAIIQKEHLKNTKAHYIGIIFNRYERF